MRRLPGLTGNRLGKEESPRPTLKCFETGRRSHTQSSVRPYGAETANGCLVLAIRNHCREALGRTEDRTDFHHALLLSASGELLPS